MIYKHNGIQFVIERNSELEGFNSSKAVWNKDSTPRCRTGWIWYRQGSSDESGGWALSAKNCKAAIRGEEIHDIIF